MHSTSVCEVECIFILYESYKEKKMKKLGVCLWILLLPLLALAQEEGIRFEDITLDEALNKAQIEGKKVFVDCYTQTCVPCKFMARNIFPQKICGDYFSTRFIALMRDMEAEGEGVGIAKKYRVQMYPTYLILNPDGSLCYELSGSTKTAEIFLERMDVEEAILLLKGRYEQGERDASFINDYLAALRKGRNTKLYQTVLGEVWQSLPVEVLSDSLHWTVIKAEVKSAEHPLFRRLLSDRKEFVATLGEEEAMNKIWNVYTEELRFYKMMDLNFGLRVDDLTALAVVYPKQANPLRYGMRFRQVINGKLTDEVDTLFPLLEEISSINDNAQRASILSNLQGLEKVATSSQCRKFHAQLQRLTRNFTSSQKQQVASIMNRLAEK
jgi:thioredoxin-related protein